MGLHQALGARDVFVAQKRGGFGHEDAVEPGSAGIANRWCGVARGEDATVV